MGQDWQSDTTFPKNVREGLERFCNQMRDSLGEQLVSVILYGGLAKGEYAPTSSDVNVMLVVNDVTVEELDKAASPVRQGMRDFGLTVMVMSENGLRRSTDVFPIKFMDMQRHHRVLWGKDVLADLPIANDHLRLRCEQEIKNLLLRLRQFYLQRRHRTELIESTLNRAVSSFLTSLNVLVLLKTGHAPTGKSAIAEAAGRELEVDEKPLQEVLGLKSGKYRPDSADLNRLYNEFMATVQKAADIVDRL